MASCACVVLWSTFSEHLPSGCSRADGRLAAVLGHCGIVAHFHLVLGVLAVLCRKVELQNRAVLNSKSMCTDLAPMPHAHFAGQHE